MTLPWRIFAALTAAPLMAGALSSCGDGDEQLSLEEYFTRLDKLSDAAYERYVDLAEGPAFEEDDPLDEKRASLRNRYQTGLEIHEEALRSVEELNAPPEARDAHNDLLAGMRGVLPALQEFSRRAAEVESQSDLEEFISILESEDEVESDPEAEAAYERQKAACDELQRIAEDNNIDVELQSFFLGVVC